MSSKYSNAVSLIETLVSGLDTVPVNFQYFDSEVEYLDKLNGVLNKTRNKPFVHLVKPTIFESRDLRLNQKFDIVYLFKFYVGNLITNTQNKNSSDDLLVELIEKLRDDLIVSNFSDNNFRKAELSEVTNEEIVDTQINICSFIFNLTWRS